LRSIIAIGYVPSIAKPGSREWLLNYEPAWLDRT
jgi:hypothetical protein